MPTSKYVHADVGVQPTTILYLIDKDSFDRHTNEWTYIHPYDVIYDS